MIAQLSVSAWVMWLGCKGVLGMKENEKILMNRKDNRRQDTGRHDGDWHCI